MKRDAQILHDKALASITVATTAFNSPVDTGRVTQVLLNLQHSFEMLLKAALVQNGVRVFDEKTGRSEGFEKCVNRATGHAKIKLPEPDAGTLRAIDAMRDDEQHWFNEVSEQLLYRYARAGVTLFDELLQKVFSEHLVEHLPERVLPISTEAPKELTLLLDDEFRQIQDLLKPGRRQRDKARAKIRTLLAMEAHEDPDTKVSSRDVTRVERGIRAGKARGDVFPKLEGLSTEVSGSGLNVTVHFSKQNKGAPVRFVSDDSEEAAGIREVDLQRKYHRSAPALARALDLTVPRTVALRRHLGIDSDPDCYHDFVFGSTRHRAYSDNAFTRMRGVMKALDMDSIWAAHGSRSPARDRRCEIEGCRAGAEER